MTDLRLAFSELIRKGGITNLDFLREGVAIIAQALMEVEVAQKAGAERGERSPNRINYRNGYRERAWDTRVGRIDLRIPKLRRVQAPPGKKGSVGPSQRRREREDVI
ncbi:MAG: transposase [Firmicutes bacterium]|nr:transposase [Bacillota bacterium]